MRAILAALATTLMATAAVAEDRDADIRAKCAADFEGDFSTMKYCIDRATKAAQEFDAAEAEYGADDPQLTACKTVFYPDFSTVMYCFGRHQDAKADLQRMKAEAASSTPRQQALTKCATDFPTDLATQAYCAKRQFEAIRELGL